jgi:CheY-like chemotaxis protein
VAKDGEQGLQLAKQGNWDLILLDVMLPRMDGFDVCTELRRAGVSTPVIMLTVHRAKDGMAPVERLVSEVMNQEPYKSARRVFWIMDNCSAHRGQKASIASAPNGPTRSSSTLRSTPVRLNQVEIYFSIVQRKLLTPNDFASLAELEQRLLAFQCHHERTASPFKWTFTRRALHTLLAKIAAKRLAPAA